MIGARVYNGREWAPIASASRDGPQPMPPVLDGDGSIFVSIVSYRDGERCGETLKSLFEKAKNPDKIVVGLVEQNHPDDKFCLEVYCKYFGAKILERRTVRQDVVKIMTKDDDYGKCPHFHQVRLVGTHQLAGRGPMFARSLVRKVLGNEEFCMQIDAHTSFVEDWDAAVVQEWKAANNEFGILSTVPESKEPKENAEELPRQCRIVFRENGFPDYISPADGMVQDLAEPLLSHAWSAAFSFAKCHLEESAPYDPFAHYAMPIEQFSRFARFWTRGYDVYTPTRNIVFHDYGPQANGHGNNEWFKRQRDRFRKAAIERAKLMIGLPEIDGSNEARANLGIYGLGKRRTMEQLDEFAGIVMEKKRGNDGKECAGHSWVPYDFSVAPVENLWNHPDNLDPQPEFPKRTNLTYYQQVVIPLQHNLVDLNLETTSEAGGADTHRHGNRHLQDPMTDPNAPLSSTLLILWLFGLVVWCLVFAQPIGTGINRSRNAKRSSGYKDK